MSFSVYPEEICENCLQALVNGEGGHAPKEEEHMNETLCEWASEGYYPSGLSNDIESFFSWKPCILCNCLPGTRYEYLFIDKSTEK